MNRPSNKSLLIATLFALITGSVFAEQTRWPMVEEGLAFAFSNALEPAQVRDDKGQPLLGWEFTPRQGARFDHYGRLDISYGGFHGGGMSSRLGKSQSNGRGLTVSLWITPQTSSESGSILRLDAPNTSLTIGQEGKRLLGEVGNADKRIRLETKAPDSDVAFPLTLTVTGDTATLYQANERRDKRTLLPGELGNDALTLLIGQSDAAGKPTWSGQVGGIAIYNRALSPSEIEVNRAAYSTKIAARNPVPRIRVRARLAGKSTILEPADLIPYTQGLCVYQYEVIEVLGGDYEHQQLYVAHWMVLDRKLLPFNQVDSDTVHTLTLEPFDDNPQLASENVSDDIVEDFSLPYFYDAGACAITYQPPDG